MNPMRASCFALAIFSLAGNYQPTEPAAVTNEDVIAMAEADLGDEVIISHINGAPRTQFDLDTSALIRLKQSGVSSEVIITMQTTQRAAAAPTSTTPNAAPVTNSPGPGADPMSSARSALPHGIHLVNSDGSTTQIMSTLFGTSKSGGGLKSALSFGIAKTKQIASVPRPRANYRTRQQRPTFLFINSGGASDLSPNNWVLSQFFEKDGGREIIVGEANAFGSSAGVDTSQVVQTTFEVLDDGNFKVTVAENLGYGEFCFFPTATGGQGGSLFDFGVDPPR